MVKLSRNVPEGRSGAPKQVKLNRNARSRPQTRTESSLPIDDLFLAAIRAIALFTLFAVHMPQCVAFDYFGVDCEKRFITFRAEGNSARGRRVGLGPKKKRGPRFKRVPGPR